MSGAIDLADRRVRQAGRAQKVTLRGSQRQRGSVAQQHRIDCGISRHQTFTHEPIHERVRVLEIWILPRGAVQPERVACRFRQRDVLAIAEMRGEELRHERAQLEANAQPLALTGSRMSWLWFRGRAT